MQRRCKLVGFTYGDLNGTVEYWHNNYRVKSDCGRVSICVSIATYERRLASNPENPEFVYD